MFDKDLAKQDKMTITHFCQNAIQTLTQWKINQIYYSHPSGLRLYEKFLFSSRHGVINPAIK